MFFKVKIYYGTDNLKTKIRQLEGIYNHTDEEDENEKQNAKNENRNDDACSLPRRTLFQFFFVFYYLFCLLFLFDDDENDDKNDGSETVVF